MNEICTLVFGIVFDALLLKYDGKVRLVLATAPFIMAVFTMCYISRKYLKRAIRAPPVGNGDRVAASGAPDRTQIFCFLICTGLLITSGVDMMHIIVPWSSGAVSFTICPLTLAVVLLILILVAAISDSLGF